MNNLAPMKNCPGGVQGNLNWMPGYFGEKKKAELLELPLPRAVFLESVKRAQYQRIIWKTSPVINPDKSMPDNYG